jgi:acetate kinase
VEHVSSSPDGRAPIVLCINTGSSSLKAAVFRCGPEGPEELDRNEETGGSSAGIGTMLDRALDALGVDLAELDVVGHRVVHGGPLHETPTLVTDRVLDDLRAVVPLAPLHQPAALDCIELMRSRVPDLVQVACFDTTFHRSMPERARRFALPAALSDAGVRRYGFHGLSYEYVVSSLGRELGRRSVIAHLGSGASLVALRDLQSVDTTMGLTPAGGLVMSTRAGDLDPGVVTYLVRERGMDADALDELFDRGSGMLAVSGQSGDMRALLDARASDPQSALAVELFCYAARKQIGALVAALGGLETLVFTGGMGARSAVIRAEICTGLGHLGATLDPSANEASAPVISQAGAACTVRVVVTDEEQVIARHAAQLALASTVQHHAE